MRLRYCEVAFDVETAAGTLMSRINKYPIIHVVDNSLKPAIVAQLNTGRILAITLPEPFRIVTEIPPIAVSIWAVQRWVVLKREFLCDRRQLLSIVLTSHGISVFEIEFKYIRIICAIG